MASLFSVPDRRSFGNESGDEALRRFAQAVKVALEPYPEKNTVLVTHGRVNTLFIAGYNPVESLTFWKGWALGTFAVLSRPDFKLLEPPHPLA
ncbi:MAG: hypothetical protein AVDCRST_MAG86-157 [uncultured Truepera sp.]|uniref:Histidine phosphatase family protein n=1 Tax=uncultured Truepera sp. TaxID=543023 RepID=A0A6J4UP88_9DEIN|nr:MAG: hypothetical protein AVDCRST_MAG86-157 [uncultured Truepera sp.]